MLHLVVSTQKSLYSVGSHNSCLTMYLQIFVRFSDAGIVRFVVIVAVARRMRGDR